MRERTIRGFPYGMNNNTTASLIKDGEMMSCLNLDVNRRGAAETRGGSQPLYSSALVADKPVTGITQFKDYDDIYHILALCDGKIFYDRSVTSSGVGFSQIGAGISVASGKDASHNFSTATLNNYKPMLISTDNVNPMWYWEGQVDGVIQTPTTFATDIQAAKCAVWAYNRLFVGNFKADGGTRYASRICWSAIRQPTDISINDHIFAGSADDPIMAMVPALKYIAVLKNDSIWRISQAAPAETLYSPADITPLPVSIDPVAQVGCVAPHSVVSYDNWVFFRALDGWYAWDVRGTDEDAVTRIDLKIDWDEYDLDLDQIHKIHAVSHKRRTQIRAWMAEGNADRVNKEKSYFYSIHPYMQDRRYNPPQPAWTRNKLKTNCAVEGIDTINKVRLPVKLSMVFGETDNTPYVLCGTFDGKVILVDTDYYNDSGVAMTSYLETGELSLGTSKDKSFEVLELTCKTKTYCDLTVTQYTEFGRKAMEQTVDFSTSDSDSILPSLLPLTFGSGGFIKKRLVLHGNDEYTKFRFYTEDLHHGFGLSNIKIKFNTSL